MSSVSIAAARPHTARIVLVLALLGAASAHLPVISVHLAEAPYMGVLLVTFSAACVLLAAALITFDARLLYQLSLLTCAAAVSAYAATRVVPFPMLAEDRGNWLEPLGVASVSVEAIAVIAALRALRCHQPVGRIALVLAGERSVVAAPAHRGIVRTAICMDGAGGHPPTTVAGIEPAGGHS